MIKFIAAPLLCFSLYVPVAAQSLTTFADSIRKTYHIPELGFAVVSATNVYEMQVLGYKKVNSNLPAAVSDKFRIGSNTKAITGFIAARLVHEGKISWNTKFFDLFPELKPKSNKAYYELTLLNLLTLRTKLFPYTYTYPEPKTDQFKGDEAQQRYLFTAWFLQHEPDTVKEGDVHFSNLGYIAAGLMLEKAAGKPYKFLVTALGKQLNIDFRFGQPNNIDSLLQPWGHNKDLVPEPPGDNVKLNWLLAAGNITLSLPDYSKFIQLQLQGLKGDSKLLTQEEFTFLFSGLPVFSVGWFAHKDSTNQIYYNSRGNPGTFLTEVHLLKDLNLAFILVSNAQTADAEKGFEVMLGELWKRYVYTHH